MNRRQRRAQASPSNKTLKSADEIPLNQPDRSKTSTDAKTLYQLAAERQATLMPQAKAFDSSPASDNVVNVKIGPNGEIVKDDGSRMFEKEQESISESEAVPPVLDTFFLATSLSALHFTLEVLTVHQYAQELQFQPVIKHTLTQAFPTLLLFIHFFRGHLLPASFTAVSPRTQRIVSTLRQVLFVAVANYAGCYLIQLTNDKGYYAVMKNAPSIGTVWVWTILELGLVGAVAGVTGPVAYAWYRGYGIW